MATKSEALQKLVEKRLEELEAEKQELEQALAELTGRRKPGRPRGTGRGPGRPAGSGASSGSGSGSGTKRRRRKGGTRSEHALSLVQDSPGIKASEIAEQLKIKPNYMYRVMSELLKDGQVEKKGMGYFPTNGAPSSEETPEEG